MSYTASNRPALILSLMIANAAVSAAWGAATPAAMPTVQRAQVPFSADTTPVIVAHGDERERRGGQRENHGEGGYGKPIDRSPSNGRKNQKSTEPANNEGYVEQGTPGSGRDFGRSTDPSRANKSKL